MISASVDGMIGQAAGSELNQQQTFPNLGQQEFDDESVTRFSVFSDVDQQTFTVNHPSNPPASTGYLLSSIRSTTSGFGDTGPWLERSRRNKHYNLTVHTLPCIKQSRNLHNISSQQNEQHQQPKLTKAISVVNPFELVKNDLDNLYENIRKGLWTEKSELEEIACYYFDGQGKAFRPMIVVLIARALNQHVSQIPNLSEPQKTVAMATEMIHTASLIHDDVIDIADTRRGKPSVNVLWGQKKAILAGTFVLSRASQMLARLRNDEVIFVLSKTLMDLVQGEFMQMGAKEDETERFKHYIEKSFKKTASLIAYTCKAVAHLSGASLTLQEAAFQYGRNLGIAFQLVDDLLDFVSSQSELGKPTAADLKLGLATAPVLYACNKFPELNEMILRRFSEPGDVEKAYAAVMESDGLDHTRLLARKHCDVALEYIEPFQDSDEKQALVMLAEMILTRKK